MIAREAFFSADNVEIQQPELILYSPRLESTYRATATSALPWLLVRNDTNPMIMKRNIVIEFNARHVTFDAPVGGRNGAGNMRW